MRLTLPLLPLAIQVGCGGSGDPAAERASQIETGHAVYRAHCATCHEGDVMLGPRLSARSLAGYETADRLFNYVRLTMPYGVGGSLSDDRYWAVVAYVVDAREVAVWEGRLEEAGEVGLSATSNVQRATEGGG